MPLSERGPAALVLRETKESGRGSAFNEGGDFYSFSHDQPYNNVRR